MTEMESRAIYAINGVEISGKEFRRRVGAVNFPFMLADAWSAFQFDGEQSVYTVGSSPDRFIIDFKEDSAK